MATEMLSQSPSNIPEWGDPAWAEMDEEVFADTMSAKLETESAKLTFEEMDIIERYWESSRTSRRCVLVMLTKPYAEYRTMVQEDRDFALAVAESHSVVGQLVERMETIVDLLKESRRWMMVALAHREDMVDVIAEATRATQLDS